MFKFGLGQDIGIDLGTATVIAYVKGKGVVLREPSVVAVDSNTNEVLAVGQEARRMLGRTPGNIVATRPLRDGVISDYTVTEKMLKYFINKVCGKYIFSPRIMICVPSRVTEVEKKAVIDAAMGAGARKVYLIEEPLAAAIGAGLDINKACGNMVVDIGGGTTDIAIIALGGTVLSTSIKIAGDKFDEAIVKYIKRKHNIVIGERTAEDLKINIGCVYPKIQDTEMEIRGRDIVKPYIFSFAIATVIVLVYLSIRYYKLNSLKVLAKSIGIMLLAQLILLAIIAIARIPIGVLTMPVVLLIYVLSTYICTTKFDKDLDKKLQENN